MAGNGVPESFVGHVRHQGLAVLGDFPQTRQGLDRLHLGDGVLVVGEVVQRVLLLLVLGQSPRPAVGLHRSQRQWPWVGLRVSVSLETYCFCGRWNHLIQNWCGLCSWPSKLSFPPGSALPFWRILASGEPDFVMSTFVVKYSQSSITQI